MNEVICPRCGAAVPQESAFCQGCGTPLAGQTSGAPASGTSPPGWQPAGQAPSASSPQQPMTPGAGGQQPGASSASWQQVGGSQPPPSNAPPQPGPYPPLPPGAIPAPPGAYPPGVPVAGYPGAKVAGNNTKWALGLGIAALFCCGPFTAIPGIFLAKKDMDEFAAGRAPQLNDGLAKAAFYLNIIALGLFVLGICLFWGRLGLLRRF